MSNSNEEIKNQELEEKKEIKMNTLRERASKEKPVTSEMWEKVNSYNRNFVEEFLMESTHLSAKSQVQYKSALYQFYYWVHETLNDKKINQIKKKDFLRYQNSLIRRGVSSNGIKMKRSAISSMNKYLINYYEDEEDFMTFRNFVEGVQNPTPNKVYNKIPLSKDELELIYKTLEEDEEWQIIAGLKVLYSSGCRRGEFLQLKKEIVNYEPLKDKDGNPTNTYKTNPVRAKGKGEQGEIRPLLIDKEAIDAINKWLEVRGEDDCEYIFISKHDGKIQQLGITTPNYWFKEIISDIVGRRINVHLTRSTRATHALEDGSDIKAVARLLSHKQTSTTEQFYDLRDNEDDVFDMF